MKTRNKALLLTLCAVLLVAVSVFGTLAYLTDSEAVTNTFTVGSVGLTLDELDTDDDDNTADNKGYTIGGKFVVRDMANKYHLIPGQTYTKDPTIHVSADSEDCYLFVKVKNGIEDIETDDTSKETIAQQMTRLGWTQVEGVENLYVFAKDAKEYNKYAVSKGANVVVFESFTIDGVKVVNVPDDESVPVGKYDLAGYEEATIVVTAYAVQKAGFENSTPAEIWNATFGTN